MKDIATIDSEERRDAGESGHALDTEIMEDFAHSDVQHVDVVLVDEGEGEDEGVGEGEKELVSGSYERFQYP